jgi:hypothetical protein
MLEQIDEEDLLFMESFYNPLCLVESLFHDIDAFGLYDESKFIKVRNGQLPLMSYEYLIDEDPTLSARNNYRLKEGAGNVWCFGGRLFGKSVCVEKLDIFCDALLNEANKVGFTSYDAGHIEGILEDVIVGFNRHPFLQILDTQIKRNPYTIRCKNGWSLVGINMNVSSSEAGGNFYQKHLKKLYIEEAAQETNKVYEKRIDSVDELGCVFRVAGMTNFRKTDPAGKVFYDRDLKPWVVNLPQTINPRWDDKQKKVAIKKHFGEQSISYRIFVGGEIVEDGISVFDMERIRTQYNERRTVKFFEINKSNFSNFRNILILEKPNNADSLFIAADIGESAPTEIIIIPEINKKYRFDYNITCYGLTHKEQFELFKWLGEKLGANFIGMDTTDGTGRAIFRELQQVFPTEHLIWCSFNEKIAIDFERDENNNIETKDGVPVYREELVDGWSIQRLKHLFYENLMDLPLYDKLDVQLNSVLAMQSGSRVLYEVVSDEDHLLAAFRVFSTMQWQKEFSLIKPICTKRFSKVGA